jgi:glycosyltransferase involved in cell wall biosynthesis
VIAQENKGQPAALNTAYAASQGDYIQYLDADDVLHPMKIAAQIERLRSRPTAVATCSWARFRFDISKAEFRPERVWRDMDPIEWLVESWTGGGMMHVAGWLIPRSIVEAAGPWVEEVRWASHSLDAHFFTRALLAASECLFCGDAKSYYRSVPHSQSSLSDRRSLEASLRILLDMGNALVAKEDSAGTRRAYADNLQRFVYSTFPDQHDLTLAAEHRIRELGGSGLQFTGTPASKAAARWIGWKTSRRLHRFVRRHILEEN